MRSRTERGSVIETLGLALAAMAGLSSCGSAQDGEATTGEEPSTQVPLSNHEQSGLTVVPTSAALDAEFRPLYSDRPDGPYLSVVEGDPDSGPSLTVFRYGQNYDGSGGLHTHTHDYRLWLIEGELKHWDESGSEETAPLLRAGSYLHQPADQPHAANCLSERCTAYVLFDGPIETDVPSDNPQK